MELMQWVAFQSESRFKSWIADEASSWTQLGEPLKVESLAMPLVLALPREKKAVLEQPVSILDDRLSFDFILKRDDDSDLPVYESKISELKTTTVFSEYTQSIHEVALSLGFKGMTLKPGEISSVFQISFAWKAPSNMAVLLRTIGLLQAGIEIASLVRGFKITEWQYHDIDIKNYVSQISNAS